jgi:hypothetical protein
LIEIISAIFKGIPRIDAHFKTQYDGDRLKRGAGYFLPGVWGCPPTLKIPQDWGI